jgi:hypothetical protein
LSEVSLRELDAAAGRVDYPKYAAICANDQPGVKVILDERNVTDAALEELARAVIGQRTAA